VRTITADRIESDEDMIHYMLDCTLATVEDIGGRARPPKHELRRQCLIAQTMVNHLRFSNRPPCHGRAKGLEAHDWIVADWASALKK